MHCLNPRRCCIAMDRLSATRLRAMLHSAGPTGPGSVMLPLQKLYLTECVAPLKSMKYLWNKTMLLRGRRDGTNRSSDIISVKCSHITKSWKSAADGGILQQLLNNVPSGWCAIVMGRGEVVSHLHTLVSLENCCAVNSTLQSKMEDRPRGTPQRR